MNIDGKAWRTIWLEDGGRSVGVIDQTRLPHSFSTRSLATLDQAAEAITTMVVRGAPLIGVTGAYGLMLALQADPGDASLVAAFERLNATRPTAINLRWALERVRDRVTPLPVAERAAAAAAEAAVIADEDVAMCAAIGDHGLELLRRLAAERPPERRQEPLNVLTHCNAGWLATVDWGTALAPIYKAHRAGLPIHVWVDETRPRNQGASLTAFELGREGVPHTVIVDNAGGHLMQHGLVDAVIVGTDRTTRTGDVCNKIGTYLKALAAHDNGVPFYVALPASTIDWTLADGVAGIPIEARSPEEVTHIQGLALTGSAAGEVALVQLPPQGSRGFNPAFDVTPARLVTALITERGVAPASEAGLRSLYGPLAPGSEPAAAAEVER
ncbi:MULTISPECIES: S-methyl-5-thioribose-1-phosphate isomerase [unclassified Synechococcus]|uniref:S-methyl-5-thioribose-1-phosphate isomerase n=1 Tax=unclassified Synechococcus TaxID=2626047 RepID=UPI000069943B|nr:MULTISPECIES: S-methyl-5-thioribose-1-phosphate isomerase [unclassified Synechococcus]EAQ76279.1 translation initiation factor IF-2B subunit alpha [Synechococcus sp. WH 5701]WFN58971.1 S-methyl-5-thioribose-1-phosphate isomerase [Synechococcus sp. CCFWC 502]